jgi:NAD(P)-dependent dehydrogenase (short-subunit alcohol dehydrogenase family)
MEERRFEGRAALVTGAGSGIGRAISLRLATEGASVYCTDLNTGAAEDTAARIAEAGGNSTARALDVTDEDAVDGALRSAIEAFDRLDVVVNNAGIAGRDWVATIDVNLSGVAYGLARGAAVLAEGGGGAVVNIASIAGLVGLATARGEETPPPGAGAYVAAKHGVVGLTRQFALLYAPRGVRVNAVAPATSRRRSSRRRPPMRNDAPTSSACIPWDALVGQTKLRRRSPFSRATTPHSSPAPCSRSTADTPRDD